MNTLKVKRLNGEAKLPERAHSTDSGLDLFSLDRHVIWPGERKLVGTGIAIELEPGYEAQVRTKSGLALKQGLIVANSPGTVDHGYANEVGVILMNVGKEVIHIEKHQKIAQLVVQKVELPQVVEVDEIYVEGSDRGLGGFGSTGLK